MDIVWELFLQEYLSQASNEEKYNLVKVYRSLEAFYLTSGFKDFQDTLQKVMTKTAAELDDAAKEVGLESLEERYSDLEHFKEEVEKYAYATVSE